MGARTRVASMPALVRLACVASVAARSGVLVTEKGGAVTDGTSIWHTFAQANYTGFPRSFALSDTGSFGRLAWGIGGGDPLGVADYATQGSLIAEKLLSLGSDLNRAIVRGWLAKAVLADDGHAFGTEGSEFHGGGQGAFEGNAELLLIARHYAAHTGDAALFATAPERFVCVTDAQGRLALAGVAHPGVGDAVCGAPPSELLASSEAHGWRFYSEPALIAPYNQTIGNSSVRSTVHAHGKAALQYLQLAAPVAAISLALTCGAPPAAQAPVLLTVVDAASSALVWNGTLPRVDGSSGWTTVPVALPAGRYLLVLVAAVNSVAIGGGGGPALPTWATDAAPAASGGSSYQTYLAWDAADPLAQWRSGAGGAVSLPPPKPLSAQLQAALRWQLAAARDPDSGAYDVLTITDPVFRGTNEAAVNSGCSYYDLFRMGYVAAYINLRFLESLLGYQELQSAGLVPATQPAPAELAAIIGQVRAALTARFTNTSTGSIISWFGCRCVNASSTLCALGDVVPGTAAACVQQWDLGFLPAQALAVKLGVGAGGGAPAALAAMRDAARVTPGQWRTNTVPFERLSPLLWLAADRWDAKDPAGFALREAAQTGDWMLFNPATGPADGNGNYGLQEENGGVLLSTSAFLLEVGGGGPNATAPPPDPSIPFLPRSGPYPAMYADWRALVGALGNISAQLASGDTSAPLLSGVPGFLRARINSSLVQQLCAAPRGPGALSSLDPWGDAWCSFYKSVSFDLPEDGLALWSFVRGMLGLYASAGGGLSVYGAPLAASGGDVYLPVPAGWPEEVSSITVTGLCVGAVHNVTLTCALAGDVGALECTTA